jgi:hypothetical protein
MAIGDRPVTLDPHGSGSVWTALRQAGYSEGEVAGNPQLLAYIAKENGIHDFRAVGAGEQIRVPLREDLAQICRTVDSAPVKYRDGYEAVRRDIAAWRATIDARPSTSPVNDALATPKPGAGGVGVRPPVPDYAAGGSGTRPPAPTGGSGTRPPAMISRSELAELKEMIRTYLTDSKAAHEMALEVIRNIR